MVREGSAQPASPITLRNTALSHCSHRLMTKPAATRAAVPISIFAENLAPARS